MDTRLTSKAALLAATTLFCAGAFAADAKSTLAASDRKFMEKAAEGGMAEVQLGGLAKQRGSSDEVKKFGAQMSQDHAKANDELRELASSKGVTLPSSLDHESQEEMNKLSRLQGDKFDHEYMEHMIKDHKKDVKDFEKASREVKDGDLKAFAAKTLSVVQGHLMLPERIGDSVIKGKHDAGAPPDNAPRTK